MTSRGRRLVRSVDADSLGPEWRKAWGSRDNPGYARKALVEAGVALYPINGRWTVFLFSEIGKDPFNPSPAPEESTPKELPPLPDAIVQKLKSFQVPAVQRLVEVMKTSPGCLDASEVGIGKTYMAIALALSTGRKLFVVAPRNVLSKWPEVAAWFNAPDVILGIVNYELLRVGKWAVKHLSKTSKKGYVVKHEPCPYLSVEVETSPVFDDRGRQKIDRKTGKPKMKKTSTFAWSLGDRAGAHP